MDVCGLISMQSEAKPEKGSQRTMQNVTQFMRRVYRTNEGFNKHQWKNRKKEIWKPKRCCIHVLSVRQSGSQMLGEGFRFAFGLFFSVCNEAWVLTGLKQVVFFIAKLLIRLVKRAHLIEIRKQLLDILLEACNLSHSLWKAFFHRVSAWLNVFCCQTWCPSKSCS